MSAAFQANKSDPRFLEKMRGLSSTAARIRALHEKGLTKSEIVAYLNAHFKEPGRPHAFRYQHVYNVLAQSRPRARPGEMAGRAQGESIPDRIDLYVDSAGRVVIPAIFRSAMEIEAGDRLMARVVDGELRLITPKMGIRRAQRIIRETIPTDVSLVDELIEERRREFEREMSDD
jgi:AbrB family looped-hinge helix DNA binding protein